MRTIKLPIIGREMKIGREKEFAPQISQVKEKIFDTLGGFLDFGPSKLSNETTISSRLLEANTEWVYINNDRIAKEVSKTKFVLYSVGMKAGEITYTDIKTHPLLDVLDKFNDTTSKNDGLYITQSHKKLTGDAFWYIDGTGPKINNLFILQPDKVKLIIGDPTDESDSLIEAYEYKDTIDGKEIKRRFEPEEIIHFKTPNPRNPFRGYGAVEAAAQVIDIDYLTNLLTRKFYENGAITNFVLTTAGRITEEQLKRFKAELRAAHGGVDKAFNTMILSGGLEPKDISYSNKDMQFLDQLEWYRDKIMVIFGNTKASLGIIDDVNRASYEGAATGWLQTTVEPDVSAIVNTINEFLLPRFGKKLLLGYEPMVPEDKTQTIEQMTKLIAANIISSDEARQELGYDPLNTDESATLRPLGQMTEPIPKALMGIDTPRFMRRNGIYKDLEEFEKVKARVKPMLRKSINGKKKSEPEPQKYLLSNEKVEAYYTKQIHAVEVVEQLFENKIKQFIRSIEKRYVANIEQEVKSIFDDEDEFLAKASMDFEPLLGNLAAVAGQEAYRLIDYDHPYLVSPKVRAKIAANVKKFTKSMLDTDRERLTGIISTGLQEGLSVPQIRGQITEAFDVIERTQSERITRTEVMRISNQSTIDAWEQSGVVEGKQWLTAGAVDECQDYDGEIVYDLGGDFYGDKSEFRDGDPPLHPNCRCVVLPVLIGEKAYQPKIDNQKLKVKIAELEAKIDKRTKAYKDLKSKSRQERADDKAYIKSLEKLIDE